MTYMPEALPGLAATATARGTGGQRRGLTAMRVLPLPTVAGLMALALHASASAQPTPAAASASAASAAAPAAPAAREIVQQRLPDGRVIFTDRPQPGAKTERRWTTTPEDPAEADARRAASQRESAAVSERIGRQIEQQRERDQEVELARAKAAQAEAEREAARARAEAEAPPPVVVIPHRPVRPRPPPTVRPPEPRPPERPGPKVPPRPGATPPPGTLVEH